MDLSKTGWIVIVLIMGLISSLQVGLNAKLGQHLGPLLATFINFLIGTLLVGIIWIIFFKERVNTTHIPWYLFIGGVIGIFATVILLSSVPKIGNGSAITAIVVGQIIGSIILDHFGFFNKPIPINISKLLGMALLLGGLKFISK